MKFGTSGLRGLARDLTGSASALYAEAFVHHLRQLGMIEDGGRVFIGRDFRESSPAIRDLCASGVARQSMTAVDCGTLPTPALAHYAMGQGAPCLMITGSHIPEDRNGIKFYRPDGEIGKDDEAAIKAIAETMSPDPTLQERSVSDLDVEEQEATTGFLTRCQSILPRDAFSGLRVGVFEHSSVARDMLHDILRFYGATTVSLGRSKTFVAVDTEAVSAKTQDRLRKWAEDDEFNAIVSTDGDADRPLVSDENGVPLRGDFLGLLTSEFVRANAVVTPVTSNSGIRSNQDIEVTRCKVGSPYVIAEMKRLSDERAGSVAGFEANGGFLLQTDAAVPGGTLEALPTRDCFLPIIAALNAVATTGVPLSQVAGSRHFPVAVADRLQDFPGDMGKTLVGQLSGDERAAQDYFSAVGTVTGLDMTDGARFTLNGDEILHYRPSGNAPELRCYCEAADENRADALLRFGLNAAQDWLSVSR